MRQGGIWVRGMIVHRMGWCLDDANHMALLIQESRCPWRMAGWGWGICTTA